MDLIFEAALSHDSSDFDEIPPTKEPVWILGRKYDAVRGKKGQTGQSINMAAYLLIIIII